MTEQQLNSAVLRLLDDNLTISFYGESKTYTRQDLHDYVVFDSDLADELAAMNINHRTKGVSSLLNTKLTEFWDKSAEKFIKSDPDIKRFFEGHSYE